MILYPCRRKVLVGATDRNRSYDDPTSELVPQTHPYWTRGLRDTGTSRNTESQTLRSVSVGRVLAKMAMNHSGSKMRQISTGHLVGRA
eukprot:2819613-Rhodomonas_salina.2